MPTRAPLLCLLVAACVWGAEVSAWELYERGREAEKHGHMAQAYILYSEAAAMEPKNQTYWLRSQAVKSRAALEAKVMPRVDLDAAAAESRGELPDQLPEATAKDRMDAEKRQPPAGVAGGGGLHDFDLREDSKTLWEDVAHAFGLDCVFDGDYVPMPAFHFQLRRVNYRDALHGMELATGTFIVPISGRLFMVVKDTTQKRVEQDPVATVSIPVPPTSSPQNFNALVTAVQQDMSIQKVAFDTHNNTVIFRDRYSKILPAIALLNDLSRPLPQVMIEMKIVEVSRNDMLTYGVDFPTLFTLQPLTNWFNNQIASLQSGLTGLLEFGGGKTLIGMGIMSAAAVAQMTESHGVVLLSSQLRGMDNQPATMHIGDRYPVLTASYLGNTGTGTTTTTTGATGTTGTGTTGTGTATGAGTLTLSQTSFTWTYNSAGDQPPSESVTISSSAGTINFAATVESSSPWLAVNDLPSTSGTLPTTLTIAPGSALTALGTGSYQGIVQVSGSDGSVAYITVSLTVNGGANTLSLSPASISLASSTGGYVVQQGVTVNSTLSGTLSANVVGPGLSISIANTALVAGTPGTVVVYGNPAGLSAQYYQGVLSVTVGSMTQEIPVLFQVTSSGSLQLSQSAVPWTYSSGGALPASTNITVSSTSGTGVTVTATAASANSWLLVNGVTTVSLATPLTLTISPNTTITQLATGTYTGTIQLSGSDGSQAYINVNLTVNGGTTAGLVVSPNPITFSAQLGGTPIQQTITVVSATAGTLAASVTGSGLTVSVPTTTVEADTAVTFTLQADPTGLSSNTYIGALTVTVGTVSQTVQVSLSVGAINSGTNGTTAYTPLPSFNFEDLGLSLKVTPSIHSDNSATLDVDLQYKVLTGQSVDGVPVISQRALKSAATVDNGQWAVIGGLLDTQEARNIAGLAGLARLPGLGPLVSTHEHDKTGDEVLIMMRPVLLTAPDQTPPHTYETGTDTKPRTPLP